MAEQNGTYYFGFTAGDGSGVINSVANPEGADIYVTRLVLEIETESTGASTINIGIAANATTDADNLIDGLSGATAGLFCNLKDAGTNGKGGQLWASDEFLNLGEASGDVTGIVGKMYVEYIRLL